jgi:uncharacterized protein YdeI (YjbR/CyaY-like superfamily)
MIATENFEKVRVRSPLELREWLSIHHGQANSVWLVTFKKHTGDSYVSIDQVLDQLLCFGWIDGLRRKLDDDRSMQLIGPRRHHAWSKTYKARAARLISDGLMAASGLAAIEASKKHGLWDVTAAVDALTMPDDLGAALNAADGAREFFDLSAPSYRRNVFRWIFSAKTAGTRQKRIAKAAMASASRERLPQM